VSIYRKALPKTPHVKYFDERSGGYARCVVTPDNFQAEYKLAQNVTDRLSPVKTVATFDVAAEDNPNLRKGATRMETLIDVKLVEPEPDHRCVGWRWGLRVTALVKKATGYYRGSSSSPTAAT